MLYRVQVVGKVGSADLGREYITNVLWYDAATTGPTAIGNAVQNAFLTATVANYGNFADLWTKVYDPSLPLHSPPVFTAHQSGPGVTGLGPRQVALCLSFYSGLNIKGQRGRIYLGPWKASELGEFATTTQLNLAIGLAGMLKNPGGVDVVHVIKHASPLKAPSNVSNYFVNNRWDTMRSRLAKETARVHTP